MLDSQYHRNYCLNALCTYLKTSFVTVLTLLCIACSFLEAGSGFGSRVASAVCANAGAPWIVQDDSGNAELTAVSSFPTLRTATYNIHSGLGLKHAFYQSRATVEKHLRGIAEAITAQASAPVDVIALNEVDFSARRSGSFDQAQFLARLLKEKSGEHYQVIYGETWHRDTARFEVRFGNAALVRHPVLAATACNYDDTSRCGIPAATADMPPLRATGVVNRIVREARGLIKFTIDFHGQEIDIVVTHLDAFVLPEREAQAAHLLKRFVDPQRTTVVLGDFNAVPTEMTQRRAFFSADRTHDCDPRVS